jgi:hypothetical protein
MGRLGQMLCTAVGLLWAVVAAADGPRLLLAGDILLGRQVQREIVAGGGSPWQALTGVLAGADWLAGNLEGALGAAGDCVGPPGSRCFAVSENRLDLLRAAGFDALSLANNHAGDLGPEGRAATAAALERAGIAALDAGDAPRFFRIGDLTLGVVALSLVPVPGQPRLALPDWEVVRRLRLARALSSLVLVYVHWGYELQDWPSAEQRQQARWLVGQGADLVVGHHPHVVQPPACVDGRPVFYSLGNHVFDQKYPATKRGLLADCRVRDRALHCRGLATRTPLGSSFPAPAGVAQDPGLDACPAPLAAPPRATGCSSAASTRAGAMPCTA